MVRKTAERILLGLPFAPPHDKDGSEVLGRRDAQRMGRLVYQRVYDLFQAQREGRRAALSKGRFWPAPRPRPGPGVGMVAPRPGGAWSLPSIDPTKPEAARFLALRLDRQHEVVCLCRKVLRALRSVCLRAGPGRQRVALGMRGVRDGILRGLYANEDSRLEAWREAEELRAGCTVTDGGLYLPPGYECLARAAGEDRLPERSLAAWLSRRSLDDVWSDVPWGPPVRVWNGTDLGGPRGSLRNWVTVAALAKWRGRSAVWMADAVSAVVALGGPAPPPAHGVPTDGWAGWAEELSRLRETLRSSEARADQAARDGLVLDGRQTQLRVAIGAQEQACARSEAALRLEERAQRAVEEVMPWPQGDAWNLYIDVLHRALGGRNSAAVSLEEVRRIPGGAALMGSAVGSLLSLGWAESVREPTPSLRVFPFSTAVLRRLRAAAKRLRQPCMHFAQAECAAALGEDRRGCLLGALQELARLRQLDLIGGEGGAPRLVRLVVDADEESDEGNSTLASPALSESESSLRRDSLLCASAAAASVCAAAEDFACAQAEVAGLQAQLDASLRERDRLTAKEKESRAEVTILDLACIAPEHLQFASHRCQTLVRSYVSRREVLTGRMREAALRRVRALRSVRLLRIGESDESLGDWAPEPWHREEAAKGKPAKRKWEIPAGCEGISQALGRVPPLVEGKQLVVTVAKAARRGPRDAVERTAGTRRKAAAVVERRRARLARGREKARLLVRAAERRQPETRTSVRGWHRREANRRAGLGREGGDRVAVEGDVVGLWSGAERADGDRHKRAREDRAGLRGRSAVQRARAGGTPGEGRGRKRGPEGDQGADLFGRTAAPRARQESVHLHFGRVGSRPPGGSGASVAGGKPAGFAARTRGAALQASAARTASG